MLCVRVWRYAFPLCSCLLCTHASSSLTPYHSHTLLKRRILDGIPSPSVPEAVDVVRSLAMGEMFSHKLSAAALFPAVYPRAEGEEQR